MVGKTVGKYRILERLGRGGMGTVYKALDETLDREVAIKVLNPEIGEPEVLKRFRAEAVSLARLNHPGIATLYELHRHEDDLLMVMEFLRGETLQTLSERLGPLAPPQAAHLCIQVLDALAHAHRAGIVHRDLKPANVMVTDTGVVKVMDFGIARVIGTEHYTNAGYMMGTPAYMAPEQVLGHEIDGRADLYAVGVMFYRLLTRELPFRADTAIAMAQKHVSDPPTPLGTFRADLPPWCEAVITKALAKSPAERFQTAEEFRAAILAAVSPVTLGELPTMATPAVAMPSIERTTTTVVLGRAHLFALAALLVVLVLGIAALGFAVLKRGANATESTTASPAVPAPAVVSATTGTEATPVPVPPSVSAPPSAPKTSIAAPAGPAKASQRVALATDTAPPPKANVASDSASTAAGEEVPPSTPPVAAAALPALTFTDVKMLVADGKARRERAVLLTLAADHLSLIDSSTRAELTSLPYASIAEAFFSRSKQPKWKTQDGKEVSVAVDFGKMGVFRGARNWVIFTTSAEPLFIRFDDKELDAALKAIAQRTGVTIRR